MKKILTASLALAVFAGVANAQVGRAVSANAANDNFLTETLFMDDGGGGNAYDGNAMLGPAFGTSSWPGGDMWGITSRPLAADTQFNIPFAMADDSISIFPGDTAGIVDETDNGRFFGVVDTVNGQDSDTGTATWTFDISGAGAVGVLVDFAAMGDFESSNDIMQFAWSIDGSTPASLYTTAVDEAGSQSYTLAGGFNTSLDDPMTVNGTALDNVFATFGSGSLGSGNTLTIEFVGGADGGSEAYAFRNIVVTPEPATLGLLALGGLAVIRRRRA